MLPEESALVVDSLLASCSFESSIFVACSQPFIAVGSGAFVERQHNQLATSTTRRNSFT